MRRWLALVAAALVAAATIVAFMGSAGRLPQTDPLAPYPEESSAVPRGAEQPPEAVEPRGPESTLPDFAGKTVLLLGDSLAAGEGGGSYYSSTDTPRQRCHRSATGWFSAAGAEVVNVGCSRAIISNLVAPQQHPVFNEQPEPAQLDAARGLAPDFTVVMLGGNDIRFADVFNRCVLSDEDCGTDLAFTSRSLETADSLSSKLAEAYGDVATAVDGKPVLVPAYPQYFAARAEDCGRISPAEAQFAAELTSALNSSIRSGVERAALTHPGVYYVPATEFALTGNGACDPEPFVHTVQPTALIDAVQQESAAQELLHPTAAGYARLTLSLSEWLAANPVATS